MTLDTELRKDIHRIKKPIRGVPHPALLARKRLLMKRLAKALAYLLSIGLEIADIEKELSK